MKNALLSVVTLFEDVVAWSMPVFAKLGVPPADFDEARETFRGVMGTVSREALAAQRRDLTFCLAVQGEDFPYLRKAHNAMADFLDFAPDKYSKRVFERVVDFMEGANLDSAPQLPHLLAKIATSPNALPEQRALAKFALFELTCVMLRIETYNERPTLAGVGLKPQDVEEFAEEEVRELIESVDDNDIQASDFNPIRFVLATAMTRLTNRVEELREQLACMTDDYRARYERWATIERAMALLPGSDAVLVRNALAETLDEQKLSLELLVSQHPVHFPDGITDKKESQRLYKKVERAKEKAVEASRAIATGAALPPKGNTVYDIAFRKNKGKEKP